MITGVVSVPSHPSAWARLAGLLSLVSLSAGMASEFVVFDGLIAPGDGASTAANILAAEPLYRLGLAGNLVDYACYAGATLLLYALLKPVDRVLAQFALVASIIGTAVAASLAIHYLAPLVLLKGISAPALPADHAQALVLALLRIRGVGVNIAMIFFGFHLVFVGWLILKAMFLPRALGSLVALGGLCFIFNSFASFLSPPLASNLLPYILLPGILGQGGLALWLLITGVNTLAWRKQCAGAGSP
jgi:hypothetical protein